MNNCFIDNRYSIIKQLSAEGNMSDVYLCNDVKTNQACAIKLFKKFSDSEETKNLEKTIFYREVETLQRVDHENIVKYIDCGIDSVSIEIIYVFLTIFLYLLKCPQSLIL